MLKVATVGIVSATVAAVNQMVRDKLPPTLAAFGMSTLRLDERRASRLSVAEFGQIASGQLCPIAHWNAIDCVEELVEQQEIKAVHLILDESDDMITNLAADHRCTQREAGIRRLINNPKVICVVSVSATTLGFLAFLNSRGIRATSRVLPTSAQLDRIGYRGLDALDQLQGADGNAIVIPPTSSRAPRGAAPGPFAACNGFGIGSEEVRRLFADFNARQSGRMFLSLGSRVTGDAGFNAQAARIVLDLAPRAAVFMVASAGTSRVRATGDGSAVATSLCKNARGVKVSLQDALRTCEAPHAVAIGQGCVKRGVSPGVGFTHLAATTSDGFNLADLLQLVGRTTGRGFGGRVVVLMRADDFENVRALDEFTKCAIDANMAGRDIMDCNELSAPQFQGLLEMTRPFNKPSVLRAMPANAKRMRAQCDGVADKRTRAQRDGPAPSATAQCNIAADASDPGARATPEPANSEIDDEATVTDPALGNTLGASGGASSGATSSGVVDAPAPLIARGHMAAALRIELLQALRACQVAGRGGVMRGQIPLATWARKECSSRRFQELDQLRVENMVSLGGGRLWRVEERGLDELRDLEGGGGGRWGRRRG